MPEPTGGVQTQVNKGGSITFMDYRGRTISMTIKGKGGDVSRGDMKGLADNIAQASNACYTRIEARNKEEWKNGDLRFYDEAEASCSEVIVLVFVHDTDPQQNQEVLIPAYDASLLVPGTNTVDMGNGFITDIIGSALGILNDQDLGVLPDDYHEENVYGYTTTRKVSGNKGGVNLNLPAPTEPDDGDSPPQEPGDNP